MFDERQQNSSTSNFFHGHFWLHGKPSRIIMVGKPGGQAAREPTNGYRRGQERMCFPGILAELGGTGRSFMLGIGNLIVSKSLGISLVSLRIHTEISRIVMGTLKPRSRSC